MRWERLGRVFQITNPRPWALSHASTPVVENINGSIAEILCSARDARNRSHIIRVRVDLESLETLDGAPELVLAPGELGLFDDSGVSMGGVAEVKGRRFLYYVGWNLRQTVPWANAIGLAIGSGGGDYRKHSRVPVLDRSTLDPYSLSYPTIIDESETLRMWYGTHLSWGADGSMQHAIRSAVSRDGLSWTRDEELALGLGSDGEYALCRPAVYREADELHMVFSHRGSASAPTYRMGYASSSDGVRWKRDDSRVSFPPSAEGWDSEMIAYPSTFVWGSDRYLLYNGNNYGKSGFGLAKLTV